MIEINIVHSRVDGRYALILTENTLTYVRPLRNIHLTHIFYNSLFIPIHVSIHNITILLFFFFFLFFNFSSVVIQDTHVHYLFECYAYLFNYFLYIFYPFAVRLHCKCMFWAFTRKNYQFHVPMLKILLLACSSMSWMIFMSPSFLFQTITYA